jgi:2-dehydro-3-deoxygluconokinase
MGFEVITFGEAMVRLAPPNFERLEQARTLDVQVGGAELNTAVLLARLGRPVAWVSRLTDNPLGRMVAGWARQGGVSTEHVAFTQEQRVGLYFLEFGAAPRASSVLYDRQGSAMAATQPGMLPWATICAGTKWFHVTGITPALSPVMPTVVEEALRAAKVAGATTSFDFNHRAKLWSVEAAAACYSRLFEQRLIDVLITSPEDLRRFLGLSGEKPEELALAAARKFQVVALTLRETPGVWKNTFTSLAAQGTRLVNGPRFEVEIVDRLGAGDAFAAGLIDGLLAGNLERGLALGTAAGALKHSIHGDFGWLTRDEIEAVAAGGGLRISR